MKATPVRPRAKSPLSVASVIGACLLAGGLSLDANADATVVNLIKQSETRIGRTVYDYVYKVQVQNGIDPLNNVVATLTGVGPGTTIMDGTAAVGNMASNAVAMAADTITIRQDRTFEFDASKLVWNVAGQQPFNVALATCVGANDKPETALQGQVPASMRSAGFNGFSCNLELRSQSRGDGASWQTASFGDCMYFDTSQTTANRTHRGVWVMDYSNTSNIVPTAYLTSTAMIDPWESLKVNERRQLLGATQANGGSGGPTLDLYDLSQDCRSPQLISSTAIGNGTFGDLKLPAGQNLKGHEGNFSPDGLTYYGGDRGTPVKYTAVDISNTLTPKLLATLTLPAGVTTHGLSFSADGNRAYASQAGVLGNTSTANLATRPAINGVIIIDVSDIQQRLPNPQMRVVSKLLWNDGGQMQHSIPINVGGKPYVVVVDELGTGGGSVNGWTAACNQGIAGHGMARIIDISDETAPKLTSRLALEVHDPANCAATLPDLVGLTSFGYDSHYCSVDDNDNATTLACGYFNSGIRVFDIRRPDHPREIAYYNPAGVRTSSPGSNHNGTGFKAGGPDFCSAQIHFDKVKRELWTTCQDNGALALKFADGVWPFTQ